MGIISSILLGALAGWLASIIMKKDAQMGALANIVVGIVGGVIGNFVAGLMGIQATADWSIAGIAISVLGAVILLAILRAFRR